MQVPRVSSMFRQAALIVAIVVLVSSCEANTQKSSIACIDVVKKIAPCADYLKESGGPNAKPSQECCEGVKFLDDGAKTRNERIDVCNCIKQALSSVGKYDPSRIPLLPKDCGLTLTLPPIDQSTDCSKVAMHMITMT